MSRTEKWSLKYDRCVKCGRDDVKHIARGLCVNCYERETATRNRGKKRDKFDGSASRKLNCEYLLEEYVNKKRSLGDIAKVCNCSRQYVYRKLQELNIPLRTLKEARELACDRNKIEFKRIDESGSERMVVLDKIRVNDSFFSSWSKEMTYVLGVVYTDGNLDPGNILDPSRKTTLRTPRLTIGQKEPELLSKVLKLMDCNAKLYHHGKHKYETGIAGDLHWFHINNEKIYSDLINLGLSPNKSKTIEFPTIPKEFVRHFIRRCWDGDGSIYFESGKLRGSYTCGSLNFIERLVQELYKMGIYKRKPPLDKTDADKMWLNYPDGRFPLKIHEEKRSKSNYIKLDTRENIEKIFHYFYDGVDESMFLSRKYIVFLKGLRLGKKEETGQLTLDLDF